MLIFTSVILKDYGKCSKNLYRKILNFEKENNKNSVREVTSFAKGGNLQKLSLPFASMVRRENKFRVFYLIWCSKF